ncbi:glutamate receptor 2.7-like [Cucurbita pepo subsp. pepo]|uniref:glutamate receptor 2.7-like n=1 Tax=Cucurbita pepo subsp. pepo TaxID=3664 RepID=UPI000C9D9AD4|nr:glutamate receptor 2.7-like [Cucurbita pepo subsp. pepo]
MEKSTVLFFFFLALCFGLRALSAMADDEAVKVKVGVVLDSNSLIGKMGLSFMDMALSDFYEFHKNYNTRLTLFPKNSMGDDLEATAAALELINKEEVEAIVGPQSSSQAAFMADLGKKSHVPIISFSATTTMQSLSPRRNPYFFRATQIDSSQVKPIASIFKEFNWRQAVIIHSDDQYGEGILPSMRDALREINTHVADETAIPQSASDDRIAKQLYRLMTMQTRVFVVHMSPELGSRVFAMAKEIGMMGSGYIWIITDGMSNFLSEIDDSAMEAMSGALAVRTYIPITEKLEDFQRRWRRDFEKEISELNIFGLRAYDAIFALAKAVERVGTTEFIFKNSNAVSGKSTDLDNLGVSRNGPRLSEALSKTHFKGIAGDFRMVEGQLKSSTYEIININHQKNITTVGFWTPENGLTQTLNSTKMSSNTSAANLSRIIWPGDSSSSPKGWVSPINEKKLRIGIPVKSGVSKFIREIRDPLSSNTKKTGYSIDIFEAVVETLPYALNYEYIRYANDVGVMAGSYDDLIKQVQRGVYDAVVGDISIRESRSSYVDFTLPYSEASVSMVVLYQDNNKKAWLFLKPLTLDLWLTSGFFFVFIGLVIWTLEHRINEDFRGPPSHEIGTSFWFAFSTMVYAQREKVESNLARFVVIVWLFVVLILTQSYTASLTSLLTVQKLEPTFNDMKQLKEKKVNVGYPNGSFVLDLLITEGFDRSKLVIYNNMAHCGSLFLNGTIAAAFDEVPYLKDLTTTYCTNCTIVGPMMKSNGFGYVFPKGSQLGRDVSNGILNIMENGVLQEIENKWFKSNISSPDPNSLISTRLGLESFWGLFLLSGAVSLSAVIIALARFVHERRHDFNLSTDSMWKRFLLLMKNFDQKDHTSPAFRRNSRDEIRDENRDESREAHPSPTSDSNY